MTSESLGAALAKRLAVAALVVVLIVAAAFAIPAATNTPTDREPLDTPEYDPAEVATTPVPAEGEIEADGSLGNRNGVVVIDDAHSNRFDRADLEPLVRELTSLGYGVRFHDGDQTLDQVLSNSNAYLVIDPGEEYESNEVASVRSYTREGGHLLLVGEPNRKRVSASLFGTSVSNQESALTSLAGRYDMSLGTSYLYNLETNGGNYKHLVARPTPESGLDLDSITMYTAAPVHSRGGTVLLRAAENTHEAGIDGTDRHAVAIHKERDNVILLGDSSFLRADRFNVGDNEQFVAYLVEYLISGDHDGSAAVEPDAETETDEDGDTGTDNETVALNNTTTPEPVTPAAAVHAPVTDRDATRSVELASSTAAARTGERASAVGVAD
ncbi:DUF4350 domain-containing protein [Salinigranum halophilum]|uniref:DUF4350 domain-containing protein n=1 Tax=Salinigranum halophilum TaxID=2565931 RepID=UPI0010A840FD|nr:DUF4350 domain-containing protein [Salinigranum halophilum]